MSSLQLAECGESLERRIRDVFVTISNVDISGSTVIDHVGNQETSVSTVIDRNLLTRSMGCDYSYKQSLTS